LIAILRSPKTVFTSKDVAYGEDKAIILQELGLTTMLEREISIEFTQVYISKIGFFIVAQLHLKT
jgi:hypothetical protein